MLLMEEFLNKIILFRIVMNKLVAIGEHHNSIFHKTEIISYIKSFEPDYILCGFFNELGDEEVRNNIKKSLSMDFFDVIYFPLFKTMIDSDAVLLGCDNLELKLRKKEYEHNYHNSFDKDYWKRRIINNNIDRDLYFSFKIRECLNNGSVLACFGASHYYGVSNDLEKNNINLELRTNNEYLIKDFNYNTVSKDRRLNTILKRFFNEFPVIGQNFS